MWKKIEDYLIILVILAILLFPGNDCEDCCKCEMDDDDDDDDEPEEQAAAAGAAADDAADIDVEDDDDDDDEDTNSPPEISGIEDITMTEDGDAVTIDLTGKCTDEDGDNLSWSYTDVDEAMITVTLEGETVTITPVADAFGSTGITFECTDPYDTSDTYAISVEIEGVNEEPVITTTDPSDDATVGQPYTVTINADDPDGDSLTWEFVVRPSDMEISSDGVVDWTPVEQGVVDVEVKCCDPDDLCDTLAWQIIVVE